MQTTNEQLDQPITGQFRSSPFYVALGVPAVCVVLSIVAAAVVYKILPASAAAEQVARINDTLLDNATWGGTLGVAGVVGRALMLTQGKIKKQLPPDLPATINSGSTTIEAPAVPDTAATAETQSSEDADELPDDDGTPSE